MEDGVMCKTASLGKTDNNCRGQNYDDHTECTNVRPRKEKLCNTVTIVPSYEEEEDWSLFGVSVNKVHLFVREFSVFFIIVETCLLLMGYCVIFGAHLTIQHGYRLLSSKKSQDRRGQNRHRNDNEMEDINNNHLYIQQQIMPAAIPRNRMIGV